METRKCILCNKEFEVKYKSSTKQFCNHKCSNIYKWKYVRKDKADYITKICNYCGNKFNVYSKDIRLKKQNNFYCSKKCSDEDKKTGSIKKCLNCGKEFYTTRNKLCSNECSVEYKKKNYKHKCYMENEYLTIYKNGYNKKGNVKLHRYIIEKHLGRKLNNNEVVHHIDGNKLNNNIDNLMVMTRGEHSKLHRMQEIQNGKELFGR